MEIHNGIAKMLFETVVENAYESSANHEMTKTIERIIDGYYGNQSAVDHDGSCNDALYSYQLLSLCCSNFVDINHPEVIE